MRACEARHVQRAERRKLIRESVMSQAREAGGGRGGERRQRERERGKGKKKKNEATVWKGRKRRERMKRSHPLLRVGTCIASQF